MNAKTIKDVAKAANVSYSTVSRAVNNRPGVKEATRRRVLEIAAALEYRPHGPARSLVNRKTHTIGLIIPDITNPFFPELAREIEERAQASEYSLMLCNTGWDEAKERSFIALLTERRVDGIIIAPSAHSAEQLDRVLARINLPVVYVSHAPRGTRRPYVVMDDELGGSLAAEHLLAQGVRSIGFIGATDESVSIEGRLTGFRQACNRRRFPAECRVVVLEKLRGISGYEVVQRLLDEGRCPEALFCENDILALGVIEGARERGMRVPDDLLVIGFDDIPFARFQSFSLSTVAQPKREMGRLAFDLLLAEMEPPTEADGPEPARNGSDQPAAAAPAGRAQGAREGARSAAARHPHAEHQIVLKPQLVTRRTSVKIETTDARRVNRARTE